MAQAPILIIGSAGKTGGRVNALLQARWNRHSARFPFDTDRVRLDQA
jgi:hypothetical protein